MSSTLQKKRARGTTFWKIWVFFFLFYLLAASTWFVISDTNFRPSKQRSDQDRRTELANEVVRIIVTDQIQSLTQLSDEITLRTGEADRIIEQWLADHETVISVSAWLNDRRWPLHVTRDDFWHQPEVESLNPDTRKDLFAYLLPETRLSILPGNQWGMGAILTDILESSLVRLSLSVEQGALDAIDAVLVLEKLPLLQALKLDAGESFVITDTTGIAVMHSGKNPSQLPFNLHSNQNHSFRVDLSPLPWILIYQNEKSAERILLPELSKYHLYGLSAGFILTILFSLAVSGLINRPLKKMINSAADIARGNFDLRLPAQRHRLLNRLANYFNYMAEEMDHLQKIDVGEIISEKNKTETILRTIADGVLVTDAHGRIAVINIVMEKWFSLNERSVRNKPVQSFIKNESLLSLLKEIREGKTQSTAEFSLEITGTREKRYFQAHAARIHDRDDHLVGVVTIIRDVTKEKEADRIKTELVSMVAHELKSPLTSIYGFSELLLESDLPDDPTREYAQVILTESTRLTDLVNKFLDLSRLEAGRTEIHKSPFDLRQLIDKIKETYSGQATKRQIEVTTYMPAELPFAFGDQDLIEQVLLNLFSNAVKYSPDNSKIGLEVKEEDGILTVNVIDNGYGIPKEALPRIFEKFFRVTESEGSDSIDGSGLGLSLAKEIVEQHDGTIKVTSRLGVGSVFSFTLPKAE